MGIVLIFHIVYWLVKKNARYKIHKILDEGYTSQKLCGAAGKFKGQICAKHSGGLSGIVRRPSGLRLLIGHPRKIWYTDQYTAIADVAIKLRIAIAKEAPMLKKSFLLLLAALLLAGCSADEAPPEVESDPIAQVETPVEAATLFYDSMSGGENATAFALCNQAMADYFKNADGVKTTWSQITAQLGQLVSYDYGSPQTTKTGGYTVCDFASTFESGRFVIQITVEGDRVAGLYYLNYLGEAEQFLAHVLADDFDAAFEACDDELREFFRSPAEFNSTWNDILADTGSYLSRESPRVTRTDSTVIFTFPATFEAGDFVLNLSVADGLIAGFAIRPAMNNDNNANALALREGFVPSDDLPEGVAEQDIVVNLGGEHPLAGKLTYPEGQNGPLPAVVLVHGSGAHGMDEAIGENLPFRDIAYTLSQQGIAVLRYNKVTYAYPDDFDNATITIDEETVDDAVAARLALLEQAEGLRFSNIYVVGHSLGGMMAPRIADLGGYSGLVMLAGSTRSLIDIAYDQAVYLLPLSDTPEEELESVLESYEMTHGYARQVLAQPPELLSGQTAMGFPAQYIYSMDNPGGEEILRRIDLPTLILQGGKDFQIYADRDFALLQTIAGELTDATAILYEDLNHLFMPSFMERPDTSEYSAPATVDTRVTDAIAKWIMERE